MSEIVAAGDTIPSMSSAAISRVRELEAERALMLQVTVDVHHTIHAGVYCRTITLPKGALLTGALVKIPTILSVSGFISVFVGNDVKRLEGNKLLACAAGRKQAIYAHEDTVLTMLFATQAKTVEEAESEFTDEAQLLSSRDGVTKNHITKSGD